MSVGQEAITAAKYGKAVKIFPCTHGNLHMENFPISTKLKLSFAPPAALDGSNSCAQLTRFFLGFRI
jgi:hypothetical protein